jgi:hypothetical protein
MITIIILFILMLSNAAWVISSEYSGPFIAMIFYAFVTFLCWRKKHFQAGMIAGSLGFGIHLYELIFRGIKELEGIYLAIFYINLIFPILLVYFSYKVNQTLKLRFKENQEKK